MKTHTPRAGWLLVLALALASCDTVAFGPAPAGQPGIQPSAGPPTQPPTPAPPAAELLGRALQARAIGDNDAAAIDLRALLDAHPQAGEARPASFYLAESFALRGRWTSAIEALRTFLADQPADAAPSDELAARALFWLARGYEQAGAWADAAATYERYRARPGPLVPYVHLREAAQRQALGQLDAAAQGYETAAASDIANGERAGAYEKAIALREQLGQPAQALALYPRLLELATEPDYRARLLGQAAVLAEAQGAAEQARSWWRELAEQLPASAPALDATARLLADPQGGLSPAAAARVQAAHEQWAAALPLYDAAITGASGDDALELRRLRGLARRASGDFGGALEELATVGAESPDGPVGRQAQLDWVQTLGQNGDVAGALAGYREFAAAYPGDERAPEALGRAAILLDRLGDSEGATQQRLDLGRRYPASEQAHDALEAAGWVLFRANRMDEARDAWDLLRASTTGWPAARAAFWAARTLDPASPEAAERLAAAIEAAPDSYYAARAAEMRGVAPQGAVPLDSPIAAEDWAAAEEWIASWSGQPVYRLAERGYPPELAQAPQLLRAVALEEVGLHAEALAEWNTARTLWRDDPVKLYLLARRAHDQGATYVALKAAEDAAKRSPEGTYAHAPQALRRLIFPTPYSEMLREQAREHGLDPLALYAMLRQESLFDPGATSWVGARGLGQVMPATAQGIAQNLGVTEFHEDDLYRPAVSIRFGAFYLGRQLATMEGSLQAALAAYNGGPGNAQRWAGGTLVADPDLFTEAIDYAETRDYVRLVYGYYGAYRRLYAAP